MISALSSARYIRWDTMISGVGLRRFRPCPKRALVIAMSEPSHVFRCKYTSERNAVTIECPSGHCQLNSDGLKGSIPNLVFSARPPTVPVTRNWCQSAEGLSGFLKSNIGRKSAPVNLFSVKARTNFEETIHSTQAIVSDMSLCEALGEDQDSSLRPAVPSCSGCKGSRK